MEISDFYIMALSFLLFFAVGKIFKAVLEKQEQNNIKDIHIANLSGENLGLEFSDDTELAHTILACTAGNTSCLVKDSELTKVAFTDE